MSASTLSKITPPDAALKKDRSSWLVNAARKLVLSQFKLLHTGCIVVIEGPSRICFGQPLEAGQDLYAEMHIKDPSTYVDIMTGGSIGSAEAYMTGDWTTPDLTMLVRVMARNIDVLNQIEGGLAKVSKPFLKTFHKLNQNSEKGSKRNIAAHYDLGNDFFELFLDPTMMYSSGIFPTQQSTMQEASENKLKTICEKLGLTKDDEVIEIGTGWGGFAIYAAKHYGCRVTTTTISEEQFALAQKRVEKEGLQERITLLKQDYRTLEGTFDKLVSIEMIEAVGWKYYDTFFATCSKLLKKDGVALIQAITIEDQRYEQARKDVDFIQRYIFPGSCIPSIQALMTSSMNASDMRLVQQEDFAEHYAKTLKAWFDKFQQNRSDIQALGYSDEFMRMWEFYLCYCEGGFAERSIGVSHLMFAKPHYRHEPIVRS